MTLSFNDRIKEARLKAGLTQEQLADKIGVAKSTVTGYEKGNSEPNMMTVQKIMESLDVDANFLWQDEMSNTIQFVITLNEKEHIKKYRALESHGKEMVDMVLDKEYDFITEKRRTDTEHAQETLNHLTYSKPEYLTGLSAGTGLFVFDDIPTQIIKVSEEYKNADFVIGVSGDSMEPTFKNNDKVAVKKTDCINIGDIGVFMVDGNGFIKELGDGVLISHNDKYEDIEINESTVCIGRVLGKV